MLLECFQEMLIKKVFHSVYHFNLLKQKFKFLYSFLNAKAWRLSKHNKKKLLSKHNKSKLSWHFAFCNLEFFNPSIDFPKFFKEKV